MTPDFAHAVDPVFEYVLALIDRIERNEERVDAKREQQRICEALDRAEAQLGQSEEWHLAKHALVCWIDEMLTGLMWDENNPDGGSSWWENNILERRFFQKADRAADFYTWARDATANKDRNALEVYYVCVILGFRGLYENPAVAASMIEQYNLPETLHEWLEQTAEGIRLKVVPPIDRTGRVGPGAPPMDGYRMMAGAMMLLAVTAGILFIVVALIFKPFGQ